MISFCQFGAGRIGAIHAANIAAHPEARLNTIVETDRAAAERLAGPYGAVLRDQAEALADPAIDAVVIASSTDTHADLVEAAARAGKAIFCEKPLDLDRRCAAACAAVVEQCGVPLMVAFNRRLPRHPELSRGDVTKTTVCEFARPTARAGGEIVALDEGDREHVGRLEPARRGADRASPEEHHVAGRCPADGLLLDATPRGEPGEKVHKGTVEERIALAEDCDVVPRGSFGARPSLTPPGRGRMIAVLSK